MPRKDQTIDIQEKEVNTKDNNHIGRRRRRTMMPCYVFLRSGRRIILMYIMQRLRVVSEILLSRPALGHNLS